MKKKEYNAMIMPAIKLIKIIYPVLKESLLGKQTIAAALKTNKIKLLTLAWCLLSPLMIYVMGQKLVSIAKDNVNLTKELESRDNAADICAAQLKIQEDSYTELKKSIVPAPTCPSQNAGIGSGKRQPSKNSAKKSETQRITPSGEDVVDPELSRTMQRHTNRRYEQ